MGDVVGTYHAAETSVEGEICQSLRKKDEQAQCNDGIDGMVHEFIHAPLSGPQCDRLDLT